MPREKPRQTIVSVGVLCLGGMFIQPVACPHCGATDFQQVWEDNRPYWRCPKGHKTFGYWRTEIAVKNALEYYRELVFLSSNWIVSAGGGGCRSYAAFEAVIDTRVDLERELGSLDFQERVLVRERYLDGLTVNEIACRHGVNERTVKRWFARIIREIAFALGEVW